MTINRGGTLATGGLSEGSATPGSVAGVGALTLTGGATVDFGNGANGSTLLAAAGLVNGTGNISVLNWTGTAGSDNGTAGNDRLLFVGNPGFSNAQLSQFQFSDDNGAAFAAGGALVIYNGFYEMVPVPKPATWASGALLQTVGALGLRRRLRVRLV